MQKPILTTGEFYHVFNRGVDKRTIFLNDRDYTRFFIALTLFNDSSPHDYDLTHIDLRGLTSYVEQRRKPLVEIIQWCLMPNHFHLLLRQLAEHGISKFMQRVGTSFSMYFNKKHQRSGTLFQGTFKAKHVAGDDYFSHLSAYIPLNPLELYWKNWKEQGVSAENIRLAKSRLLKYKWSSFNNYFGGKIVPPLACQKTFFEVFGGSSTDYEKFIENYCVRGLPPQYAAELVSYEV